MPLEGYQEIARHLGRFVHTLVEKNRLECESLRLDFRGEEVRTIISLHSSITSSCGHQHR